MDGEIYASVKDLTRPRSSGRPANKHAVAASQKIEPNYDRMQLLSNPRPDDAGRPQR